MCACEHSGSVVYVVLTDFLCFETYESLSPPGNMGEICDVFPFGEPAVNICKGVMNEPCSTE